MERSDKPTEYIMLKGNATSEWDACDFAIVHITEQWKKSVSERLQLLKLFKNDNSFSCLAYSEIIEGFYRYTEETEDTIFIGKEACCFIEVTRDELQELPEVNAELSGCELCFNNIGLAWYRAYCDQSNDQFFTETFNIKTVIEELNNNYKK